MGGGRFRKRAMLCGLVVMLLATWAVPGSAASKSPVETLLPSRIFGHVKHARCVSHRARQFGFPNGKKPGRHDAFVDIREACTATIDATPARVTELDRDIPCGENGPIPKEFVVCSLQKAFPEFASSGELVLFAMQVHGEVPHQNPAGESIRLSLYINAGGGAKSKATASFPDVASTGTNVLYQIVMGDPGTTVQPSIELLAVDRRKPSEFIPTNARIVLNGDIIEFVVPKAEIGDVKGVRGATFVGSRTAQGDASQGVQEVVPGGVHAPYGFIPYSG